MRFLRVTKEMLIDREKRPDRLHGREDTDPARVLSRFAMGPFLYQFVNKNGFRRSRVMHCNSVGECDFILRVLAENTCSVIMRHYIVIDRSAHSRDIVALFGDKIRTPEALKRAFDRGPFYYQFRAPLSPIGRCEVPGVLADLQKVVHQRGLVVRMA